MRLRLETGLAILACLSAFGCSKGPTALEFCQKLEGAGVATACHVAPPAGMSAAASETALFELKDLPEHDGIVCRFKDPAAYDKTEAAFAAESWTGPHRFGSRKALVFVNLNSNTPSDIAAHAKELVDAL
jgi:hypothetical protein